MNKIVISMTTRAINLFIFNSLRQIALSTPGEIIVCRYVGHLLLTIKFIVSNDRNKNWCHKFDFFPHEIQVELINQN